MFPLGSEEAAQVVDRVQSVWMLVAQFAAADFQRLAQKQLSFVEFPWNLRSFPKLLIDDRVA